MEKNQKLQDAIDKFGCIFEYQPDTVSFAPGRVNLIGEHTDYNDGFVLPFALPYKTYVVGSRNDSGVARVFSCSQNSGIPVEFAVNQNLTQGDPQWANYVKGTVFQYLNDIPEGFGFDAVIATTVPIGSGLSSSASLEVAIATFIEALCGDSLKISLVEKAKRCQTAERTFANTPCGIMDQYIAAMGVEGNLLLVDCRSHEFQLVPFGGPGVLRGPVILVTNSNVKHSLSGSEYPDRVKQCNLAVAIIQKYYPEVRALRDATMEMVEAVRGELSPTVYSRAKHCVSEDVRTLAAVEALKARDYEAVGRCMTESHVSLREDFEVSCPEIDFLVDLALQVPGVLGSRITGGGFGGCTVTLVERDSVSTLKQFLSEQYAKQTGYRCDFYVTEPSAGAGFLHLRQKPSACAGDPVRQVSSQWTSGSFSRHLLSLGAVVVGVALVAGLLISKHA